MTDPVSASEFTRNFGRYRMAAQRQAVPVSSHGQITGYFVGPDEYQELQRYKYRPRVFSAVDLSDDELEQIGQTKMDPRHDHLNALLDKE